MTTVTEFQVPDCPTCQQHWAENAEQIIGEVQQEMMRRLTASRIHVAAPSSAEVLGREMRNFHSEHKNEQETR